MGVGTGIAIFFIIWWVCLFITLPFRMKSQLEVGEVVEGSDAAAPAKPQLLKRMFWNTLIASIIFFLFWLTFYYFDYSVDDLPQIIKIRKLNP
ncbi:MAG: DUF1467 family protein [Rhizobiaceae bacterium]